MGLLTALLGQELPENQAWRDAAGAAGPDDPETVLGHLMERTMTSTVPRRRLSRGRSPTAISSAASSRSTAKPGTCPQLAIDAMD